VRLAIFSAFPQEIKAIVRNLKAVKRPGTHPFPLFSAEWLSNEVVVAVSGMGSTNAETALEYVCDRYRPEFVLSLGFGGALYEGARIGEIVWSGKFFLIREKVEEALESPGSGAAVHKVHGDLGMREGSIFTVEKWTAKSEIKKFLTQGISFPVCDMETFFLAKPSLKRGLPFLAVRAVTDLADEDVPPEFISVSDETGTYRLSRALKLILSRPKLLKNVVTMGRNSGVASSNLSKFVKEFVEVI
jgi:adenosylhomocysteine nucleosidase